METDKPLSRVQEQIKALKELTAEQIGNLKDGVNGQLKAISERVDDLEDEVQRAEDNLKNLYVTKEYLAQSLSLQNEKYLGEINKIYAKFDPIRSVLYFIATTIGGVFLVALAGFVLKGFSQGVSP